MNFQQTLRDVEQQIAKLARLRDALRAVSGNRPQPQSAKPSTLSAAARERIAAAQRARWAKVKKAQRAKAKAPVA